MASAYRASPPLSSPSPSSFNSHSPSPPWQGLGNLMEALADCGRSKALDPSFVRAQTRMAALLQEVRRLEDADRLLSSLAGATSTSRGQQQQQPAVKLTAQERATVQVRGGTI
jgi:DnaJ family protein C protein 7